MKTNSLAGEPILIYMHIPKSGGSSLRKSLEAVYGESSYCYSPMKDRFEGNATAHRTFTRRAVEICEGPSLRLVYGHIFYGFHELISRQAKYITLLRDPVKRVLSNYYYRCEHAHCRNPMVTLKDYVFGRSVNPAMRYEVDNLQTRFLSARSCLPLDVPFGECNRDMLEAAKENLALPNVFFGITEDLEGSLQYFRNELSWPRLPPLFKERVTRPYPGPSSVPQPILDQISKFNALDIELYEYALAIFRDRALANSRRVEIREPQFSGGMGIS